MTDKATPVLHPVTRREFNQRVAKLRAVLAEAVELLADPRPADPTWHHNLRAKLRRVHSLYPTQGTP